MTTDDLIAHLAALPDDAYHVVMVNTVAQRAQRANDPGDSMALALTLNNVLHLAHTMQIAALDAALRDLEIATVNLTMMPKRDVAAEIERLTPHRRFWRFRLLDGLQRLAEHATQRTKR